MGTSGGCSACSEPSRGSVNPLPRANWLAMSLYQIWSPRTSSVLFASNTYPTRNASAPRTINSRMRQKRRRSVIRGPSSVHAERDDGTEHHERRREQCGDREARPFGVRPSERQGTDGHWHEHDERQK